MIRIVIMVESSFLADAIVSNLAGETGLDIFRLAQPHLSLGSQAIHPECSVLIIIEEGKSKDASIMVNDFLHDFSCFRLITLSPRTSHCYEMPVPATARVIDLATDVSQENSSEAKW